MYLGHIARAPAVRFAAALPQRLECDEQLYGFFQAIRKDTVKANVIVCFTDRRVVVFDEVSGSTLGDAPLSECSLGASRQKVWSGAGVDLRVGTETMSLQGTVPVDDVTRLRRLLSHDAPSEAVSLLPAGMDPDPNAPAVAVCGTLLLHHDRLVDWADQVGRQLPFSGGETRATVDTAGNIAVTRGRNLAAKGLGTVLLGPIGLFMVGNAKENQTDTRELFLLIEGPGWAFTRGFPPTDTAHLHEFAGKVNVAARAWRTRHEPPPSPSPTQEGNSVGQLAQLADLHERGLLTKEEFAAAKAKILGG